MVRKKSGMAQPGYIVDTLYSCASESSVEWALKLTKLLFFVDFGCFSQHYRAQRRGEYGGDKSFVIDEGIDE